MTDYTPEWYWIDSHLQIQISLMNEAGETILSIMHDGGIYPGAVSRELIASAPRLKQERDDLLAALETMAGDYQSIRRALFKSRESDGNCPSLVKARELIERIDRE